MAKQARSYANLTLGREEPPAAVEPEAAAEAPRRETRKEQADRVIAERRNSLGRVKRDGLGDEGKTVKSKAHQWLTYLRPEAVLALKRYALEAGCKPMDCSVEAFELWFKTKGIDVPVRVRSDSYGSDE